MKSKILVVDDSGLARRLTRKILEELGFEVEEAADGPQALEKYVLERHDLIILDIVMHGIQGLEVLTKFKQLNPKVPVIILTADIQRSTRDQAKAEGAAGVLNKPVNREQLAELLALVQAGGNAWN
jgi:two-component system chemotaxis response regulator CheY